MRNRQASNGNSRIPDRYADSPRIGRAPKQQAENTTRPSPPPWDRSSGTPGGGASGISTARSVIPRGAPGKARCIGRSLMARDRGLSYDTRHAGAHGGTESTRV